MEKIDTSLKRVHPYSNLQKTSFWKSAIAEIDPLNINQLWKSKFPISRESKIITVGSCFAQHISKSLKLHGFSWVDSEPAPENLPQSLHAECGHGVFSFRTGNIYTAALLKQWIFWATGKAKQSPDVFVENDRCYDPFRPTIPLNGYSSAEELFHARDITLKAIADSLKQADIFVFTLGLTEAWKSKAGYVYPMCPGTIRGEFSSVSHVFHNFQYEEVIRDLGEIFDELRKFNPRMRFILTVSPVPLTATASQDHVLTATTYSKSVLRAATGFLARMREDVDYFPSYELISAAPFKGRFFEQNMRSVTSEGVAFVMRQFLSGFQSIEQESPTPSTTEATISLEDSAHASIEDTVCEDIILETWSHGENCNELAPPPNIVLIGDSHMGKFAEVLDELGVPYAGGGVMNGSEWHDLKFAAVDDNFFVPLEKDAKARWAETIKRGFSRPSPNKQSSMWIITNIGSHSHMFTDTGKTGLFAYMKKKYGPNCTEINPVDVRDYLLHARSHHLNLVRKFVKEGFRVIWVSDPPMQENPVLSACDSVLSENFGAIGCSAFNAREWILRIGGLPAEFRSTAIVYAGQPDPVHGSDEYYRQLVREIFSTYSIV